MLFLRDPPDAGKTPQPHGRISPPRGGAPCRRRREGASADLTGHDLLRHGSLDGGPEPPGQGDFGAGRKSHRSARGSSLDPRRVLDPVALHPPGPLVGRTHRRHRPDAQGCPVCRHAATARRRGHAARHAPGDLRGPHPGTRGQTPRRHLRTGHPHHLHRRLPRRNRRPVRNPIGFHP